MRYYIIAGEASGDLHGSNLMKGIYAEDPQAEIRFWGGDLMADVWQKAESGGMGMKNRATPLAAGGGAQPEGMGGVVFHPHAIGLAFLPYIGHQITSPETDFRLRVLRVYPFHQIRTVQVA